MARPRATPSPDRRARAGAGPAVRTAPSADLSAAEARRLALRAQGLAAARPARVTEADVDRALEPLTLVQLDAIHVLVRAHYLPLFSRLGPYPTASLDHRVHGARTWFETWAHEACIVPAARHRLWRWRMARAPWAAVARMQRARPGFLDEVVARIAAEGPLPASAFREGPRGRGGWWTWDPGKHAVEWLLATGRLAVAARPRFMRLYDLAERVLPAAALAAPTPAPDDAQRALLLDAARALGVATLADLADHPRLRGPVARPLVADLVAAGDLVPTTVEGWREPGYRPRDLAPPPAAVAARALVSPFDSLVFHRGRTERLFGFHHRLEVYTPARKRRWGYYVLPFLLGDRLVARVDLAADRAAGRLRVPGAHLEPGAAAGPVAAALAEELGALAGWLGLGGVVVGRRGGFAGALRKAVAARA